MEFAYARIGNESNSAKVWIAKPFNIKTSFETKTIIFGKGDKEDYYVTQDRFTGIYTITPKERTEIFVKCEPNEANYIVLPYYNGNDFIRVVRRENDQVNSFVVREKMHVETAVEKENNIVLPNGRDNQILGIRIMKNLPTDKPKYEGDMDSVIQVYNEKAFYIKHAFILKE